MARVAWRNLSLWKKIGSNIRGVRKWKGFTDIEVSEKIGMDIKKYRRLERGETESISLKEIMNIINVFDVYTEEIIPLNTPLHARG